ncbi:MAG: pilus assembly FimT family protein [Patescibacteria group bacterium]
MNQKLPQLQAMTIIEVLLTVSLMGILATVPFALDSGITYRIQTESAQSQIGHALRKAQLYAQQGRHDSSWGVSIQSSSVIVFAGNSYATRNQIYDDILSFDSSKISISVTSGSSEVLFAKTTGVPSAATTVSVTSDSADAKSIVFSTDGRLTYN